MVRLVALNQSCSAGGMQRWVRILSMKRREGYNSTREGEKYAQWLVHQDCSSWWLCGTLRRAMAPAMTMKYLMSMGMERGSRVQQQIQSRLTNSGSDLFKVEV